MAVAILVIPGPVMIKHTPRLTAGTGIAIGHEASPLLVARGDVLYLTAFQATVQLYCVYTGNAKQRPHAVGLAQQMDQQIGAGHRR